MSERDAYVEKMKARIDEWNTDIDKLQAKAADAQADARVKYEEQLAVLRQQRDEAQAKMKESQDAGDAAWDDMRKGMAGAWDSMTAAWHDAMKRFK